MTMTTALGGIALDIVIIKNPEDAPTFHMKYGPTTYLHLEPGQSVTVQEEVAWHYLGRWWMDNRDPRTRDRVQEYRRLRILYGAYEDDVLWEQGYPTGDPEHGVVRVPAKPRIEAYTPAGERITTVVDDPDGTYGGQPTAMGREASLESTVAFLSEQLRQVQAKLDGQIATQAALHTLPDPDVNPTQAPPTFPQRPVELPGNVTVPMAPPPVTIDGVVEAGAEEDAEAPARLAVTPEAINLEAASLDAPPPVDKPAKPRTGGRVGSSK